MQKSPESRWLLGLTLRGTVRSWQWFTKCDDRSHTTAWSPSHPEILTSLTRRELTTTICADQARQNTIISRWGKKSGYVEALLLAEGGWRCESWIKRQWLYTRLWLHSWVTRCMPQDIYLIRATLNIPWYLETALWITPFRSNTSKMDPRKVR